MSYDPPRPPTPAAPLRPPQGFGTPEIIDTTEYEEGQTLNERELDVFEAQVRLQELRARAAAAQAQLNRSVSAGPPKRPRENSDSHALDQLFRKSPPKFEARNWQQCSNWRADVEQVFDILSVTRNVDYKRTVWAAQGLTGEAKTRWNEYYQAIQEEDRPQEIT